MRLEIKISGQKLLINGYRIKNTVRMQILTTRRKKTGNGKKCVMIVLLLVKNIIISTGRNNLKEG